MLKLSLLVLLAALTLAGCGGMHVRPPADYASNPQSPPGPPVVRVAFDQLGDVYPRDASAVPWPERKAGLNSRFALRDIRENVTTGAALYGPQQRQAAEDAVVAALESRLRPGDTLLVLIHGFNEDFATARSLYETSRKIAAAARTDVVLEVYWDGLRTREPSILTQQTRVTFWPDGLLSSNYAGQRGLRPILNRLTKPVDLRVLAHSRGTAVALAAVADPVYDGNFGDDPEGRVKPLANPNLRSIRIAAFAPAVGNGHLDRSVYEKWGAHDVDLAYSINPRDFALSKIYVFKDTFWGDTSLGTSEDFSRAQIRATHPRLSLTPVRFHEAAIHGLDDYVKTDPDATNCVLHSAGLSPEKCAPGVRIIR